MPNKKNKKKNKGKSVDSIQERESFGELAKDSAKTALHLGPALIFLVVKFIVVILLLYVTAFAFVFFLPAIMVALGALFSVSYEAQLLDILCILGLPGVFICLIAAGIWFSLARVLWTKIIVPAAQKVRDAVA